MLLPDTMGPCKCLILDSRIPPWIKQNNATCGHQIHPGPAGFKADQENGGAWGRIESVNQFLPVACFARQDIWKESNISEHCIQTVYYLKELREHQYFPALFRFVQNNPERDIQLAGFFAVR